MWTNDGKTPLYAIKRKYAEEYHTGSASWVMPKVYKLPSAKPVCNDLNKYLDHTLKYSSRKEVEDYNIFYKKHYKTDQEWNAYIDRAWNNVLEEKKKGPWVIVCIQITAGAEVEYA